MDRIPFRVYDFFAYLTSGAILVFAWDWFFGPQLSLQKNMPNQLLGLAVLLSYVVGHAASHISAYLFEAVVVGKFLTRPSNVLMGGQVPRGMGWLFPGYYKPLDAATRDRISRKAEAMGLPKAKGEALFQLAFSRLAKDAGVLSRLDEFRDLYGFARNSAFAFLAVAIALLVGRWTGRVVAPIGWATTSAALGVTLFYRYLKFFRQYAYHLLVVYSDYSGVVHR